MTTKFLVITIFPNTTRTAIPVSDIVGMEEDRDGHAVLWSHCVDGTTLPKRNDLIDTFNDVIDQLRRLGHVD